MSDVIKKSFGIWKNVDGVKYQEKLRAAWNRKKPIPKLKDCIPYIEACGWKFSHRSVIRTYVFYQTQPGDNRYPQQVAFTLSEIRHAFDNGW